MRSHRTALVIDYSNPDEPVDYRERVGRLLESLNGVNIKVDVYSYYGPGLTGSSTPVGLQSGPPLDQGLTAAPLGPSFEEAVREVASQGYSQVLTNRAPAALLA